MSSAMPSSRWLRSFHPAPDAPTRLVCLPHAGGSATYYFPVSKTLSPGVEVLAAQYPGRQDRRSEPCLESIPELARQLAGELAGWTDKPLTLFGHSMGASVAFETARLLAETGVPVLGVIASGRCAPSTDRVETVHLRDDEGILRELRELEGTDTEFLGDDELVRMVMPAIRGDYTAVARYRCAPGVRIPYPIAVMVGDEDSRATVDEARAWEGHTSGGFDLRVFPGGHFYLNDRPAEVTAAVAGHIARWSAVPDRVAR
ncbi:alpha/beta fold hydrolase [Streptomyces sp. NPDC006798]|uniref:thioesterase II family protein n=1 Tax=Streptomyces sp. NPDC006798 TaxID=3155462 RepID=UPI0033C9ABC0